MTLTTNQYQAKIEWRATRSLVAGRSYILDCDNQQNPVTITAIKYRLHPESGEHLSTKNLNTGEAGVVVISTVKELNVTHNAGNALEIYDADTHTLVAIVEIQFALRRSTNIRWQQLSIDKAARAQQKKQVPVCIWFTGLSGSGKSTIANFLEKRLYDSGKHTYLLDGDNVRHGLNQDLGFTEADRVENIRRIAEVAKLMVDAGLIVIASFISPFQAERQMARELFSKDEFIEIFIDTPLAECENRDVKGLYAKARRGELKNFTGIDSAYERPEHPELTLDTCLLSAEECVEKIIQHFSALQLVNK